MTLDEALDTYWAAAYAEGQRGATHDTPEGFAQTALNAVWSCLRLQAAAAIAAEREACAKLVDAHAAKAIDDCCGNALVLMSLEIRERSNAELRGAVGVPLE